MVGAWMVREVDRSSESSPFAVKGAVDHSPDPGLHQGSGAHWTGFKGHDQRALIHPPIASDPGCLAQGHQLRMPHRV